MFLYSPPELLSDIAAYNVPGITFSGPGILFTGSQILQNPKLSESLLVLMFAT